MFNNANYWIQSISVNVAFHGLHEDFRHTNRRFFLAGSLKSNREESYAWQRRRIEFNEKLFPCLWQKPGGRNEQWTRTVRQSENVNKYQLKVNVCGVNRGNNIEICLPLPITVTMATNPNDVHVSVRGRFRFKLRR